MEFKYILIHSILFYLKLVDAQINKDKPPRYLPLYRPTTCGELTFHTELNDTQTKLGEHPWVVGLVYLYPATGNRFVECSGVLIAERYVLTQGICVIDTDESYLRAVRVGEWNRSSEIDCVDNVCADKYMDLPIAAKFINYDSDWRRNDDIAIIKLWLYTQYSRYVAPICLPNVTVLNNLDTYDGLSFVVSGWSRTPEVQQLSEIKLKRSVVVAADEICENYSFYQSKYNSSMHFCSNSSAVCTADGPVMAIDRTDPDNPYWYIVGFFLYAKECERSPKMFTKVAPYMEWILENTVVGYTKEDANGGPTERATLYATGNK